MSMSIHHENIYINLHRKKIVINKKLNKLRSFAARLQQLFFQMLQWFGLAKIWLTAIKVNFAPLKFEQCLKKC